MQQPTAPTHTYFPYLDGWRGIAILIVLLHHFAGFGPGDIGVQVFFVLSGKLMSQVLFVDRTPLTTFYRRRVARVFPVFYLYLATIALASVVFEPSRSNSDLFYTAIFLRTYLPGPTIWSPSIPIGHLWSLNVEEHSYLVLSLVAGAAAFSGPRTAKVALPLLAVGCLVAYALYSAHPPIATASPAMLRTECAAFGLMLSAALHLYRRRDNTKLFWPAFVVTLLLLVADMFGNVAINPIRLVLLPAALAVLVNVIGDAPKAILDLLSAPWLRWFGVVSFSLYVWQQPFLWLSMRGYMSQSQGCLLAILAGAASYYWFEAPMRSWIRDRQARTYRTARGS